MPTIAGIVERGQGRAHAWYVITDSSHRFGDETPQLCELYHYSTRMLVWRKNHPSDPRYLDYSIGWGSVSDQNGMNTAFRKLGLNFRYDRDNKGGGARITELELNEETLEALKR